MALEKAAILNLETDERIEVMFNPEEYTLSESNLIAEIPIPGAPRPPLQYVRGQARQLSMELFFDTYEISGRARAEGRSDVDVRALTTQITNLARERPETGAPPVLLFSWGGFAFRCLLAEATQRIMMFSESGTPVRANLSVTFREFEEAVVEVERGLFIGPPTVRQVIEGDALSFIAGEATGDPAQWRAIAEANGIDDPFNPPVGQSLVVPPVSESGPASGGG